MVRILIVLGLLAVAACAGPQSDSTNSQHSVQGLYGSFNGGGNAM